MPAEPQPPPPAGHNLTHGLPGARRVGCVWKIGLTPSVMLLLLLAGSTTRVSAVAPHVSGQQEALLSGVPDAADREQLRELLGGSGISDSQVRRVLQICRGQGSQQGGRCKELKSYISTCTKREGVQCLRCTFSRIQNIGTKASRCTAVRDPRQFVIKNGTAVSKAGMQPGESLHRAVICPRGTAKQNASSSKCLRCTGRGYQPKAGQTKCLQCPLGRRINAAHTTCTPPTRRPTSRKPTTAPTRKPTGPPPRPPPSPPRQPPPKPPCLVQPMPLAATAMFDDMDSQAAVPAGYAGLPLVWNNFFARTGASPPLGYYLEGVVSSPNIIFNGFGKSASIAAATPGVVFALDGFAIIGAFPAAAPHTFTVTGTRSCGTQVEFTTVLLDGTQQDVDLLDFVSLTRAVFTTTTNGDQTGRHFAIDNMRLRAAVPL